VLYELTEMMPALIAQALALNDEAIGVGVVSQAIASARHETQYSRLFRS
jgi:urease accessory protein